MLSLPTPSWQKARAATFRPVDLPGLKQGRTPSLILPRLYLGDYFSACDEKEMERLGITHTVTVMEEVPAKMPEMVRHHVPIQDRWDADILQYLDGTTKFIGDALAENPENKVLVHCFMGISRSSTVVCAYVMATSPIYLTAAEAIDIVKVKRGIVNPNTGFRVQLATYGERFIGNRTQTQSSTVASERRRSSRISEGIAARIRRLKTGSVIVPATDLTVEQVGEK
ncbi:hypothetical protein HWV62_22303 [Athelia sp. TMB]|nr:hypothetical protein HWV62_3174 [Athelia sp. TMB]KAF7983341.1 hypothetical protein HWV62_22303 [Athelia sp. TMB]